MEGDSTETLGKQEDSISTECSLSMHSDEICSFCLEGSEKQELINACEQCRNQMHEPCLRLILSKYQATCPLCRKLYDSIDESSRSEHKNWIQHLIRVIVILNLIGTLVFFAAHLVLTGIIFVPFFKVSELIRARESVGIPPSPTYNGTNPANTHHQTETHSDQIHIGLVFMMCIGWSLVTLTQGISIGITGHKANNVKSYTSNHPRDRFLTKVAMLIIPGQGFLFLLGFSIVKLIHPEPNPIYAGIYGFNYLWYGLIGFVVRSL